MSASSPSRSRPAHRALLWMLLGAAVLAPFAARPAIIGGDEPHFALMAHSMAVDGDIDLTGDYREVARGAKTAGRKWAGRTLDPHLREVAGREVFKHPLGLPALAAPFLWLEQTVAPGAPPDLVLGVLSALVSAAGLIAGWRLMIRLGLDSRAAAAAAASLYFTTPLWYYGRTFFTEPYLWALTVVAAWAAVTRRWLLLAVLLGLLVLIKETAVLTVAVLLLGVALAHGWRRTLAVATGVAVAGAAYVAKNLVVYGLPLETFQRFHFGDPFRGAVGLLVDGRHGLLPFAPIVLVACAGWFLTTGARGRTLALSAGLVVAWFALTACWSGWRGGSCYGPRLLVPAIPAFAVPLAEVWRRAESEAVLRRFLMICLAVGFVVQWCAVTDPFFAFWSPSVVELVARRPLVAGCGLLGAAGLIWRVRPGAAAVAAGEGV